MRFTQSLRVNHNPVLKAAQKLCTTGWGKFIWPDFEEICEGRHKTAQRCPKVGLAIRVIVSTRLANLVKKYVINAS
jgi:hypothetical protein